MKPVIEVSNISKSYQISHQEKASYDTIKDDFAKLIKKPFGGGQQTEKETFWALKDINFQVNQGESFGIVGKNGSGKSTLLKILSRIVDPSSGTVKLHGKVASLLEVGTGFHPELTGRENIYFNGSMIGMSKQEITRKFNEIVEFSGVEQFLDTPVKFYSSGMYVRLAFSVAAHLESEILIIDEVLSVGDAAFQKKSLAKMNSIAKEGRTILFVSHSMSSVKQLCSKALLLEKGRIKYMGEAEFVTNQYLSRNIPAQIETHFKENKAKKAQFLQIEIRNQEGQDVEAIDLEEPWKLYLKYKITKPCDKTMIAVEVLTVDGSPIYMSSDTDHLKSLPTKDPGTYEAVVDFGSIKFVPGTYYLRVSIQSPGKELHDMRENFPLKIRQNPKDIRSKYFNGKYMGLLSNKLKWEITKK
jgi:lipopolysaccharide transport system ATP-binding protein